MRKLLYIILSLSIVVSSTQTAFAASSWSITSAVSAGSRTVVTATKAGYKSAINIAPTAGRLALNILKRGNQAYLIYAIVGIIGEGIDYTMDPANNRVIYKSVGLPKWRLASENGDTATLYDTADAACAAQALARGGDWVVADVEVNEYATAARCYIRQKDSPYITEISLSTHQKEETKYLSAEKIASQVMKNAAGGHAPSQAVANSTAVEMVVAGDFDADLLAGAVPTTDTKPLIPAVPGSQNGNEGYDGSGDAASGTTPGQQAADAAKAAADAKNAADAAKDAAKAAGEQAAKDADAAQDLINSAADQAAIAAAEAKAAASEKAAADAKAVSDAAVAAANDRAAAAEKAAAAATKSAADAAAKAASDLAAAKAAGDAAAIAAAEAASAAAAKELATAKEKQAAAEKAAEAAKAEAAKPFELPAFCTWAKPVCTFIDFAKSEWLEFIFAFAALKDWFLADDADTESDNTVQDSSIPLNPSQVAINFAGSCPAPLTFEYKIYNQNFTVSFPFDSICKISILINPVIKICASIAAIYIVAGLRQGSS